MRIPNWEKFQHYNNRNPPWIKLHKGLLDNVDFAVLPVASRALAPLVWLLASESETGGELPSTKKMAWRLRMSESELVEALQPLVNAGFVEGADGLLAESERGSSTSREETELETEKKGVCAREPVAPDAEAIDRLDADLACEEKRFHGLMLALRDSGEDVQAVLDSLPRPKDRSPFSARWWLNTGRSGISRSEGGLTVLRLTCDALEARARASSVPVMSEKNRTSFDAIDRVVGMVSAPANGPRRLEVVK